MRIKYIVGLRPIDKFDFKLEFGNLWHAAEEHYGESKKISEVSTNASWYKALYSYHRELLQKYGVDPSVKSEIVKWFEIIKRQFPIYINHWLAHPDVKNRQSIAQEEKFDIQYPIAGGRLVRLRGKYDGICEILRALYLDEHKARGTVNPVTMRQRLKYDLQTMMYICTLSHHLKTMNICDRVKKLPIAGVRYNVIRRPLAGGLHSIRQKQDEKTTEFYDRLRELINDETKASVKERRDAHYFMRWTVKIYPSDIQKFEEQTLKPLLAQIVTWYDWVTAANYPERISNIWESTEGDHFRTPYGIWQPLMEDGSTEYDAYLQNGSQAGLERTDSLFTELQ